MLEATLEEDDEEAELGDVLVKMVLEGVPDAEPEEDMLENPVLDDTLAAELAVQDVLDIPVLDNVLNPELDDEDALETLLPGDELDIELEMERARKSGAESCTKGGARRRWYTRNSGI